MNGFPLVVLKTSIYKYRCFKIKKCQKKETKWFMYDTIIMNNKGDKDAF